MIITNPAQIAQIYDSDDFVTVTFVSPYSSSRMIPSPTGLLADHGLGNYYGQLSDGQTLNVLVADQQARPDMFRVKEAPEDKESILGNPDTDMATLVQAMIDAPTPPEVNNVVVSPAEATRLEQAERLTYSVHLLESASGVVWQGLQDAGIITMQDVLDASEDKLTAIHGIGKVTASNLQTEAQDYVNND